MTAPETAAQDAGLFAGLGASTTRNMTGGTAFHGDGRLDRRSEGALATELAAAGQSRRTWTRPSDERVQKMGCWSRPESAEHDATAACALARRALAEN